MVTRGADGRVFGSTTALPALPTWGVRRGREERRRSKYGVKLEVSRHFAVRTAWTAI